MPNQHFEQDSLIRFKATFKDLSGVVTDPTAVTLRITKPATDPVIYTYGTDAELIKDSTGVYHMDFSCEIVGEHKYRWRGTGAVQIAIRDNFFVDAE